MADETPDATDTDVSALAREVVAELDSGTVIDDKLIISRRLALSIATGAVSASALLGFGVGDAQAQEAAGQVGTSDQPVDVYAAGGGTVELEGDVTSESVSGGYDLTIDGDTYEFRD